MSSTARTNKANILPNDQVAAQVTNELKNAIENDTFGHGCHDGNSCLIVLIFPTENEVYRKDLSPLYISLGGVTAGVLLVVIPFVRRQRRGTA